MTDEPDPRPSVPRRWRRLTLGTQILIAVAVGLALGVFLGDLAAPAKHVGDAYVGLLKMTVLPFVVFSLVTRIGRLTVEEGRRLAGASGGVQLLLWGLALGVVVLMAMSLPELETGSFFRSSLVDEPAGFDFLGLYIPLNPFHAIANEIVPAAVFFALCAGVAVMTLPQKEALLAPLDVATQALARITDFVVVRLSPLGTCALMAHAAGTLELEELGQLQAYLVAYTLGAAYLSFVLLPATATALLPITYPDVVGKARAALLTAFATGKLFPVLPMVIEGAQLTLMKQGVPEERAGKTAAMLVPLAYPFPNAGKLLNILFVPFAAWFLGEPLALQDFPWLLALGLISVFGSPLATIPFLLDVAHLPIDMLQLFLLSGVWCARVSDVAGAMHLSVFTLLAAGAGARQIRFEPTRIARAAALAALGAIAVFALSHGAVSLALRSVAPGEAIVARIEPAVPEVEMTLIDVPAPNPVPIGTGGAAATVFARAKERGVLRVGFDPRHRPFSYLASDGRPIGLAFDVIHVLAAQLELELEVVSFSSMDLVRHLQEDHFDVAISGVTPDISRLDRLRYTSGLLDVHGGIVVPDHRRQEFRSLEAIRQLGLVRLGIVDERLTPRDPRLNDLNIELVVLDSPEAFFEDPDQLGLDALVSTLETGSHWTMRYPRFAVLRPSGIHGSTPYVFAVARSADDLLDTLDGWTELNRDGVLETLYEHWILGQATGVEAPRWSVIRDVLGWVD